MIDSAIRTYQIMPLSDRAALVSFGNMIDESVNERILLLHKKLLQQPFDGFVESTPAYASLAIFYDLKKVKAPAGQTVFEFVKRILQALLERTVAASAPASEIIKIPVCYDVEFGIDISQLATDRHLDINELISLHTASAYRVYMIGFTPGFAYMGTLDNRLVTPRRDHPRLQVPAGSVGIAGAQTGIYPIDSPGGWQIIGKTPLTLFNADSASPCLLSAGDRVQFFSISKNEFEGYHAS